MTRPAWWLIVSAWSLACGSAPTADPPEGPPPPPPPGAFRLTLKEGVAHDVARGEVLAVTLEVHREPGFGAPIDFTFSSTAGIVVIFRPATVIQRDETDLLIVADQMVPPITHDVHLIGNVDGKPITSVVLKLSVSADP